MYIILKQKRLWHKAFQRCESEQACRLHGNRIKQCLNQYNVSDLSLNPKITAWNILHVSAISVIGFKSHFKATKTEPV